MNVSEYYSQSLAKHGYRADAAQTKALARLQLFYDDWVVYKQARSSPLRKLFKRPSIPRGVYLWGGVGRGKSFLMDAFYQTVPLKRKARLHFHEFMQGVHRELDEVKGQADPLDAVALKVAKRYRLICFDEFHVSDIADAMILYRLLLKLFEYGVAFVMTSNYEPSKLYPNGLHRDRVLPAIKLIHDRLDVLNVDAGVDYRRRTLEQVRMYLTPITAQTQAQLQEAFDHLSDGAPREPVLTVQKRELRALALSGSVVWFDFETLCGGPRSQNDYLELASRFHTVILSGVPRMSARQASAARRFTWLVDVFYDHKVKLIISAECEADQLYTEGQMSTEFHRTVSRILEMQSKEYLEAERRQAAVL
jgi:cell division protein ZapE